MTGDRPSWEELNAYVDGELAAEDAARVARAIADDPAVAERMAALTGLKAAVQQGPGPAPPIDLPPTSRRRPRIAFAAAAAVLIAAAVGVIAALLPGGRAAWFDPARAAHAKWAAETAGGTPPPARAAAFLTATRGFAARAHVPDLSAARLTVTRVRRIPARGDLPQGVHVGYAGTRGCRVSLWIAAAPDGVLATLTRHYGAKGETYAWRVGGLAYALFASGMDPARFAVIAEAAYQATRAHAAPDPEMRTALTRSRRNSRPCGA